MSIFGKILNRRTEKQVATQAPELATEIPVEEIPAELVVAEQVETAPAEQPTEHPAVEESVIGKPVEGQEDLPAATSELDPVSGQDGTTKSIEEAQAPDDSKIETVPLGKDELTSLRNANYDANKAKFSKTFVIEKMFWAHMQSTDPTNPGRRAVRVRRVAEIRAASLLHALNLLGWDNKSITVASVKDDFKGEIAILVNGKQVSTMTEPEAARPSTDVPFVTYANMGGSQRKAFVAAIKDGAVSDQKVKDILAARKFVVSGWTYEPHKHINLKTAKAPKEAPAKPQDAVVDKLAEDQPQQPEAVPVAVVDVQEAIASEPAVTAGEPAVQA